MSDRTPWECPRCNRVLAPFVAVCPCSEPGGTAGVVSPVTTGGDGGGVTVYAGDPPPITGGTAVTWPGSTGTVTWTGNTVISRSAA